MLRSRDGFATYLQRTPPRWLAPAHGCHAAGSGGASSGGASSGGGGDSQLSPSATCEVLVAAGSALMTSSMTRPRQEERKCVFYRWLIFVGWR